MAKSSSRYRKRPGPSSLARPKTAKKSLPEASDEDRSEEETPKKVYSKDEVTYWRHIGKVFALEYQPWLPRNFLKFTCRCESPDDIEGHPELQSLVGLLNNYRIGSDLRVTRGFQSEVRFLSLLIKKSDNHLDDV